MLCKYYMVLSKLSHQVALKKKKNYSQYLLKQWDRLYPESLLQWDIEVKNQAWFWQKKMGIYSQGWEVVGGVFCAQLCPILC